MDLLKAQNAIEKIDVGLKKYVYIMSKIHMADVSADADFQTKHDGFCRIRRNEEFRKEYFGFMESKKRGEVTFGEVLYRFYDKLGE